MANWFHSLIGKYDIGDKWIGLDYSKLFMAEPAIADSVLAHEIVHSILGLETDFGQATTAVIKLSEEFKDFDEEKKNQLINIMMSSQKFAQEGIATAFQISRLSKITNKKFAIDWADKTLPQEYLEMFEKLKFVLDMSQSYRDYFFQKIPYLALDSGIRKNFPSLDPLKDLEDLKNFISTPEIEPNSRLLKIVEVLKYKPWIVTKPMPEIAASCGLPFITPASKQECADFLTYLTSKTNSPKVYTVAEIGDPPQGMEAFTQAFDNLIVANMNLNFRDTATIIFEMEWFLRYADKMELIFVNPWDDPKNNDLIKSQTGTDPEVYIAAAARTGDKYLTATSKVIGSELLNNELKDVTLMVKWGGYDLKEKKLIWSDTARTPDLVIYNTPTQLADHLERFIADNPDAKMTHLHMGAREDHPLQSLIVKIEGYTPLFVANDYGNVRIANAISKINKNSRLITEEELKQDKKHINNLMSFWNGMNWDVDWVETMIDGKDLRFRV